MPGFVVLAGGAIMVGVAQWVVYHNYFGLASKNMKVEAGDKRDSIMRTCHSASFHPTACPLSACTSSPTSLAQCDQWPFACYYVDALSSMSSWVEVPVYPPPFVCRPYFRGHAPCCTLPGPWGQQRAHHCHRDIGGGGGGGSAAADTADPRAPDTLL